MSTPTSASAIHDDASFEDILSRLSEVVERLEEGELPLERSLSMFEEGIRLSRLGQRRLDEAESRVERLLSDEDGVTSAPIDSAKEPE